MIYAESRRNFAYFGNLSKPIYQGLYSLSGDTSYRKISRSLEATILIFRLSNRSKIWPRFSYFFGLLNLNYYFDRYWLDIFSKRWGGGGGGE